MGGLSKSLAYNALSVLAWLVTKPVVLLLLLFLLFVAVVDWVPATGRWVSTLGTKTYEECILAEMRGQAGNVLEYAKQVCSTQ